MTTIGTPLTPNATTVLLCGSGELGKELAIELQRLGVEVVAIDSYPNAPAMQVAHRFHVIDMQDEKALRHIINEENPTYIVPEVEAIATDLLIELEKEGFRVIPTAQATKKTMNRAEIRKLASEELQLPTSPYRIVQTYEAFETAAKEIGLPVVVKPIMSSSGKGQSVVHTMEELSSSWNHALNGARGRKKEVIVEGLIKFDSEITLLTVRHNDGAGGTKTTFCAPIGHRQVSGDYVESWQPHPMNEKQLTLAKEIAEKITSLLGGWGLFGVELFLTSDKIYFNEVSPRPHDTGMVTLISQNLSEFALHARAILGLPIPHIEQYGPAASSVITATGSSKNLQYQNLADALLLPKTDIRLFGKPEVEGKRRMGVALALDSSIEEAKRKATNTSSKVTISY